MGFVARASIATKLMMMAGTAIACLLLLASWLVAHQSGGVVKKLSQSYSEEIGTSAAEQVAGDFGEVQATAISMAASIAAAHEAGIRDRATIMAMVKPNVMSSDLVMGAWFFAAPDAFDGQDAANVGRKDLGSNSSGAFEPYWARTEGQINMEPPENNQVFGEEFYTLASSTRKPAITEPYSYDVGGKSVLMTSMAAPVISHGKVIGVAGLDIALDDLSGALGKLRPFGDGRVMLLSGGGKWVSHPDVATRMKDYADTPLADVKTAMGERKSLHLDEVTSAAGDMDRLITPVSLKSSNATWAVVVDAPEATVNAPARNLATGLAIGGLAIVAAVLAALMIAARKYVAQPLGKLTASVAALSAGRYDQPVTGAEAQDEVGAVARALDAFRHDLANGQQLRAEQTRLQAAAEAERARNEELQAATAREQAAVVTALETALAGLSDGDLTTQVNAEFAPEYAQLKRDFNAAMTKLRTTMTTVVGNTGAIGSGAGEISQAADDLSRRTEQQAASLEETAAALDEITATVRRTAEGAIHARDVVSAARSDAERSRQVVDRAMQAMGEIEQSSTEIGQIIGVIDEIAFQTNLLALNAGVEAARAGDAGRGFAVVASEVRALAQRSAEAAKEIKTLISASSQQVGAGVELVAATGEALQRIAAQVTEITDVVTEIANSAQEQATGLHQVNTAVNQMDQVTQQNAAMVEQSTAASHALANESTELTRLMSQFKIGGPETSVRAPTLASPARAQQQRLAASYATQGSAARKADTWEDF